VEFGAKLRFGFQRNHYQDVEHSGERKGESIHDHSGNEYSAYIRRNVYEISKMKAESRTRESIVDRSVIHLCSILTRQGFFTALRC